MIVNPHPEGWEIIHQRAHGLLAAQICFQWQVAQRPVRFLETVLAAANHDDAQDDFTGQNYLTATGAPMNFNMQDYYLDQPRKNAAYSLEKSRWMGLMTSMHVDFLFAEKRKESKELEAFLKEEQKKRVRLEKDLKLAKGEAQRAYELLEWCDALSLILCQNRLQPEERKMEISKGPDGTVHQLWQRSIDGSLGVTPWCFEPDSFVVFVEARVIRQLSFGNDKELAEAIRTAEVTEKTWHFKKA